MEVPQGHAIPLVGLGDREATHEHVEKHIGVVPQKEPYLLSPVRRTGRQEVEVRINSTAGSNEDIHIVQSRCSRA
jgi:hypothetical protein